MKKKNTTTKRKRKRKRKERKEREKEKGLKAILRDPKKNSYNTKIWIEIQKIELSV